FCGAGDMASWTTAGGALEQFVSDEVRALGNGCERCHEHLFTAAAAKGAAEKGEGKTEKGEQWNEEKGAKDSGYERAHHMTRQHDTANDAGKGAADERATFSEAAVLGLRCKHG